MEVVWVRNTEIIFRDQTTFYSVVKDFRKGKIKHKKLPHRLIKDGKKIFRVEGRVHLQSAVHYIWKSWCNAGCLQLKWMEKLSWARNCIRFVTFNMSEGMDLAADYVTKPFIVSFNL